MKKITNQVREVLADRSKQWYAVVITALIILNTAFVINRAWVSDDSYITFRVIENFVNGYGLTWNVGERVQVFTHPLWLFHLTVMRIVIHNIYVASIFTSIVISIFTLIIFTMSNIENKGVVLGLLLLGFSNAFVDYSTSGLENPLSHLLIIVFTVLFLKRNSEQSSRKRDCQLFLLSLLACLGVLTRWDYAIFYTPALIYSLVESKCNLKRIGILFMGFLPLFGWVLFSTFYYGFPLPNTFYAKVGDWLPRSIFIRQGWYYFLHTFFNDPVTALTIVAGILMGVLHRSPKRWMLTLGGIFYLGYVMYIGGDFMGGRYLTGVFLVFAYILVHFDLKKISHINMGLLITLLIILNLTSSVPTWKAESADFMESWQYGIVDERMFYYSTTGLLRNGRINDHPEHPWVQDGKALRLQAGDKLLVTDAYSVGFLGYYAGPNVHIVDRFGLTSPFIARIPPIEREGWRIGHFDRKIPTGYLQSIETDDPEKIQNEFLRRYVASMNVLIKADLMEKGRLCHIWDFNRGIYDQLLKAAYAN